MLFKVGIENIVGMIFFILWVLDVWHISKLTKCEIKTFLTMVVLAKADITYCSFCLGSPSPC
jgi:hypothetical protein